MSCRSLGIRGQNMHTPSYRLFWDWTGGYPAHKLVRLSPLGNANWGPQCPLGLSESEAKTCTPSMYESIKIEHPLLSAILGLDWWTGLVVVPSRKCKLGASVSCRSLRIRGTPSMYDSIKIENPLLSAILGLDWWLPCPLTALPRGDNLTSLWA